MATRRHARALIPSRIAQGSLALTLALLATTLPACKREQRNPRPLPAAAGPVYVTELSPLHPGPRPPLGPKSNSGAWVRLDYEHNAQSVSEAKNLYLAYNCVGCHSHGGGGMGPPLMDDKWLYGSQPDQVFESIVKGRPNGMPAFEGKIPEYQVWQLVAYVRSLSGQLSANVASARDEHMKLNPGEASKARETPKLTPAPPDVLPLPATSPATAPKGAQ